MRFTLLHIFSSMLLLIMGANMLSAQDGLISRKHHLWGHFEPGAWKEVRVVSETLDEEGKVVSRSTTRTKTTLEKVEPDGVTLRIEVTIEMAGKEFETKPQIVKQGFHGELNSPGLHLKRLKPGEVVVEGKRIACDVYQLELVNSTRKTVSKIYFSSSTPPYVLKKEKVTTNIKTKARLAETTMNVVDLNFPCIVLDRIENVARIKSVHRHAKGTTTTAAVIATSVPGGIVCHGSQELDEKGHLIRRSALELIDYGLEPKQESGGLFHRRRSSRFRFSPHSASPRRRGALWYPPPTPDE